MALKIRLLSAVGFLSAGTAFAIIVARPQANPDVLEPSIQNEVDHALSLVPERPAETNRAVIAACREFVRLYATNGMNATERAISLVSLQRNGEWRWRGTNVTAAAVKLLEQLAPSFFRVPPDMASPR